MTQNEIDAAKAVTVPLLNVQTQEMMSWPKSLTVAKAYIDQLERSRGLDGETVADLRNAITKAEASKKMKHLGKQAKAVEKNAGTAKNAADAARMKALADVLKQPVM